MEAIVLAGGLGTRLKTVLDDIPKPMAPVGNKPFLEYILEYLFKSRIKKIILSVGYKYEVIKKHFGLSYKGIPLIYSIENEPLGTGGAIKKALEKVDGENVLILNGDTFFTIDINEFLLKHEELKSDITIALKPMNNFDRYGSVILKNERIVEFKEKQFCIEGIINGGIYVLKTNVLDSFEENIKFSFEKDVLENKLYEFNINGFISNNYFIDIGIPSDYYKAQKELHRYI